jgi:Flp pilus assembly protein TadG
MMALRGFLKRFSAQTRGNVAVTVALAIIPVTAAIGAGVDFANVINAKARLQDATDSAAIAAALNSNGNLTSQTAAAKGAFCDNISAASTSSNTYCGKKVRNGLETASGVLAVTTNNNIQTMNYTASASVPTVIIGGMANLITNSSTGMNSIAITAKADAGVTMNAAEIVFVLDNTGSMAQKTTGATVTKMAALKTSLDATLASLLDSNGNNIGKTKVALVPFDTQVALDDVAGMGSYAGSFATSSDPYTCSGLTSAQCTALVSNYSDMCGSSSACLDNNINYTGSYTNNGKSYYSIMSTSYYKTNSTYRNNGRTYYYYYIMYKISTYRVSGTSLTYYSGSDNGDYYGNAAYYSPPSGYNYQQYTGTIAYTSQAAGGYNSGSTVVIKDNDTITANSDLLGVTSGAWTGCVIDRNQSYDVTSDAPVATNTDTLYPAAKCATNSLLPIMDLTTDIASARTYAAKMTPAGNTNVTIGIQWGMEVLSPSAPFTSAAPFTDKTINKYMIILTDGMNTQNRWSTSNSAITARMSLACENAKKLGITVFTVRLEAGDSTALQNCASNSNYYYNLSSSNEISGTLGSIMKSIKKIRLTN